MSAIGQPSTAGQGSSVNEQDHQVLLRDVSFLLSYNWSATEVI
ncbi:unnamed protein product, partial [Linum tenue]